MDIGLDQALGQALWHVYVYMVYLVVYSGVGYAVAAGAWHCVESSTCLFLASRHVFNLPPHHNTPQWPSNPLPSLPT